jgi:Domain of unknown function (DUF6430)
MLWQPIKTGAKLHWRRIPGWVLSIWGVVWLVTASSSFFSESVRTFLTSHFGSVFTVAVVAALAFSLWKLYEPTRVSFSLKHFNTTISIQFGDLFSTAGHIVVPVGEFFDSELGDPVAVRSVHGQFIQRVLGGNANKFNDDVDRYLVDEPSIQKQRRTVKRNRSYAIGTTAVMTEGARKYFLLAFANTDLIDCKASASIQQMFVALAGLWEKVRNQANNQVVHIPLVGGAVSGVSLEPIQLLRVLLMSILIATRSARITDEIEIVLHESLITKIDIRAIAEEWK